MTDHMFLKAMEAQFGIIMDLLKRGTEKVTEEAAQELAEAATARMRVAGYDGPPAKPEDLVGIAVIGLVAALKCFEVSGAAKTVGRALGADLRAETLLLALSENPQGHMTVVSGDSELGKVVGAAMQDDEMDRRAKEIYGDD